MPELRRDPIVGRWVIIATERARRPSDLSRCPPAAQPSVCPFCAGHEDKTPPEVYVSGRSPAAPPNSPGWKVRAVPNRFPALKIKVGGPADIETLEAVRGVYGGPLRVDANTGWQPAQAVAIIPVGHDFPPFSANKGGSIEGSRLYLLTFDLAFQLQEELRALEGGGDMPKDLARDPASRRAYVVRVRAHHHAARRRHGACGG